VGKGALCAPCPRGSADRQSRHVGTAHAPMPVDLARTSLRAPLPTLRRCHPSFGSSVVDHSARLSQSLSGTVMTCVTPSIATRPKNCKPSLGGWFGALGAFT